MKKYMFIGFAAAVLAACGSDNTEKVRDAKCVKIAQGYENNYVVKCEPTETLTGIQAQPADSMFISGFDFYDLNAYAADQEHIYVEVNPNASNGNEPIYRVMVKSPVFDNETMYSVMAFVEK